MRPIHIAQHSSTYSEITSVVATPHPALRCFVREYVGGTEDPRVALRRRELPSEIAPLIITFGAPFRLFDAADRSRFQLVGSFLTGAYDTYALVETTGPYTCVQVNFTIAGARLFLQQPLKHLANREVPIDNALGRFGRELESRLHDAPTWAERFDLLDQVILARVTAASTPPPAVMHAWQQLVNHRGEVEIASLVRESGWSHKHFVAQFSEHFGLSPKVMARVLRFGRAAELLQQSERGRLADIAYACGYYDQAHFTRDFTAFAGVTPTSLLASQLPNRGGYLADG
jgi:AraC-like DNA-binding protein